MSRVYTDHRDLLSYVTMLGDDAACSSVAVRFVQVVCARSPFVLLSQGFHVDFVVFSLCPACTEHIWNLTVQTVSECSEVW